MGAYFPSSGWTEMVLMLQRDMERLASAAPDRSLEGLESDIWHRIDVMAADRRSYTGAFAVQMVILAVGTMASLAAGHQWATSHPPERSAGVFSPYTRLAASTLLVGDSR